MLDVDPQYHITALQHSWVTLISPKNNRPKSGQLLPKVVTEPQELLDISHLGLGYGEAGDPEFYSWEFILRV